MATGNTKERTFLRKVLYRIDYQLIPERIQEDLFYYVGQTFGKFFSEQEKVLENSIDIEFNPTQIDQPRFNQKAQPVVVFSNPQTETEDGRILKIGRTFLYLELSLNTKPMDIEYYEWMAQIVSKLQESGMFRLSRIGLRKFNCFYILKKDIELVNELFSIDYLSQVKNEQFSLDNFEDMQIYYSGAYSLNFHKTFSSGDLENQVLKIEKQPAHMIAFDFDLHTSDASELDLFKEDAKAGLERMNVLIYKFFSSVIDARAVEMIEKGQLLDNYSIIPF